MNIHDMQDELVGLRTDLEQQQDELTSLERDIREFQDVAGEKADRISDIEERLSELEREVEGEIEKQNQ